MLLKFKPKRNPMQGLTPLEEMREQMRKEDREALIVFLVLFAATLVMSILLVKDVI